MRVSREVIERMKVPPCKAACPAGVDARDYINLIREGKFLEALKVELRENPLPAVCGRICPRPCEVYCTRGREDEPVAIRALKRFLADWALEHGVVGVDGANTVYEEEVAVIGSGPAGLTAAYMLAGRGYPVTVFEALPEPGGLLRYGVPEYRLPRRALKADVERVTALGVEIKTREKLGEDFTIEELFQSGYKAVFIATGAHTPSRLRVEGEDFPGVIPALEFLKRVNMGEAVEVGDRVAVVGGGNVAIDAARTAIRLGSREVHILYRRSRAEMPASPLEVRRAEEEGVKISLLVTPTGFIGDGRLKAVRLIRMRLGEPDESGRRRPIPIPGSEFTMEFDTVIEAIGQKPDTACLPEELKLTKWGTIEVDPTTLETSIPGVFAGGDVVTGPATVIEAIAAGKRAAESIHRYLRGRDLRAGRKPPRRVRARFTPPREWRVRVPVRTLSPEERVGGFEEVELGYTVEDALKEAGRCLRCGVKRT